LPAYCLADFRQRREVQSLTSREFQKAANQRLTTAEFLFQSKYNLDAMYLAGYTIECTLKALILELVSHLEPTDKIIVNQKELTRDDIERAIMSGARMHRPDVLAGLLKDLGQPIPPGLAKRFGQRRFGWSTELRYESGRRETGEVRWFLKLAQETYEWVENQLP
jgi:hypothetical protein